MAYRFRKKDYSTEQAFRRIAREQFDRAVDSIDDADDQAVAVHDVRQRCKKLRALIRLVRPSFEKYEDENADISEIARLLSGSRDIAVLAHSYERLAKRYGEIDAEAVHRFKSALQQEEHANPAVGLREARERLVLARRRVTDWTLGAEGWEAIGPGLMRTYMRARTALDRIGESHSPDRFHKLRKHVKYHMYHMAMLRPINRKELEARADLADEVAESLGQHHDLAVLEATLRSRPKAFGPEHETERAQALALRHRLHIEKKCLRKTRWLLAERADSLTERLGSEWDAWRGRNQPS